MIPTLIVVLVLPVLSVMPRTVMSDFLHCIHKVPTLCGISDEVGVTHCASADRQELGIVSGRDELRVPTRQCCVYSARPDHGSMAAKRCVCPRTHCPATLETSCPIAAPPTGLSGPSLGTAVLGSCFRYCSIADGSRLASYWVLIAVDGDTAAYLTILPRHHDVDGVEIDLDACNDRFALGNRESDPTT
jgi:hypothetical protein